MRIRKCASKLLGSANAYASPPLRSPSSESWDSQASAAAGLLCELNRSPWDLIPNLHDSSIIAFQEEEKEQGLDRGIMGNSIKLEEEPIPLNKSKEEMEEREEKDKRKKKKIRRKRKEKEIETGSTTAAETTVSCKKSDGKGWHCKRPANLPHSLCLYHLAQLRSYSYSHSKVANPRTGTQFSVQNKKGDASGDGGNLYYYYYYAGFGPWRGKRRGDKTGDVVNGDDTAIEHGGGGEERGKEDSKYGDECDAPVAGDDEEEGDEDDGRVLHGDDDDGEEDSSDEEKKRNRRKRGRKPVKARSLKSLL
uniref:Nucleolin isoform X2 n=1 Tax=Elaeis guineensis var. tenera TaxID=51953 RepID=A0A6I9RVL9_ELAGV|nr:nucleolin isoform X2 [Elaeis guineensis]